MPELSSESRWPEVFLEVTETTWPDEQDWIIKRLKRVRVYER
jgi:hypothetical protein